MNLPDPRAIIGVAFALLIAGIVFFVPIGKVEETVIEYTNESLQYKISHVQDRQVPRWIFWNATEVQYLVKNADTVDGLFTMNFVFSNEKATKSSTRKITILRGAQEAVTEISPLNGVSNCTLTVVPPYKIVPHQHTVSRDVTLWDRIWDLKAIFGIR